MVKPKPKPRPARRMYSIADEELNALFDPLPDRTKSARLRELVRLGVLVERLQGAGLLAPTGQLQASETLLSTRFSLAVELVFGDTACRFISDLGRITPDTGRSGGAPGASIVAPEVVRDVAARQPISAQDLTTQPPSNEAPSGVGGAAPDAKKRPGRGMFSEIGEIR